MFLCINFVLSSDQVIADKGVHLFVRIPRKISPYGEDIGLLYDLGNSLCVEQRGNIEYTRLNGPLLVLFCVLSILNSTGTSDDTLMELRTKDLLCWLTFAE